MFVASMSGQIGQVLEGMMILCFGISWPFSILRTWRAKKVEGKSLVFLVVVLIGYVVGMGAKFVKAADGKGLEVITLFYGINTVLVAIDLSLYLHYRSKNARNGAAAKEIISPPVE
jgi:hypothetical protein